MANVFMEQVWDALDRVAPYKGHFKEVLSSGVLKPRQLVDFIMLRRAIDGELAVLSYLIALHAKCKGVTQEIAKMQIAELLMRKNKQYGNSALEPVRCFSSASPEEQIRVRLDDKLSRMLKGDPSREDEDVLQDAIGYLVLLIVACIRR